VLNFWGSGKSHLEWWRDVASPQLGNTRDLYVYVPPYFNPMGAQAYPVLYMHDGQNIFDDKTCCFGNGGWEVNNAADAEIVKAGLVPYFIVGVANTAGRNDEYTPCIEQDGSTTFGGKADLYEQFLIGTVIPLMEGHYHIYADGRAIAGSSLGGTISMYIGLRHPDLFPRGIGSMSGAFWICESSSKAARDEVKALAGHLDLPIYLDSGGDLQSGDDGAKDTVEVRDLLKDKGWLLYEAVADQPCAGAYDLCYHLEQGAQHNETAWRARVWRMLGYLF
jgi:predicted alpha/beta superfamily hydrolase